MTTLDKIKADVNREYKWLVNTKYTIHDIDIAFGHIRSCIDKYAEQEPTKREIEREYLFQSLCEDLKKLQAENDDLRKRLEQEPCDDVVSRQAVLDGLKGCICEEWIKTLFATMVKQLPSVRPQEQTGHWIIEVWNNKEHHTCSNCQHIVTYEPCYHYCPYCGAKMVKPQESEKVNCESTKCENCINHNYCDFEPQESEDEG